MDRFIAQYKSALGNTVSDLKSNMDRFIGYIVKYSDGYISI